MSKTLPLLLYILFITACSNNNKNEIPLFNNIVIKKATGEQEKPINELISNTHKKNLSYKNIQVPLYKYLSHKDYKIFIGLPYHTTIKESAVKRRRPTATTTIKHNGKATRETTHQKERAKQG